MERAPNARRSKRVLLALGVGAVLVALIVFSQRALAEALARLLAGLWLSVMDFVLRVLGMFFGG